MKTLKVNRNLELNTVPWTTIVQQLNGPFNSLVEKEDWRVSGFKDYPLLQPTRYPTDFTDLYIYLTDILKKILIPPWGNKELGILFSLKLLDHCTDMRWLLKNSVE